MKYKKANIHIKKQIFNFSFAFLLFYFLFFIFLSRVHGQGSYPIPELDNCRDAKECYLYCEIPQNTPACWSYGKYVLHGQVLAESDEDLAKKHGITFPIAELGNCTSIAQCKSYCDTPANHETCISFAKKKGFHKEVESQQSGDPNLLSYAQSELGCNSESSCRAFCEQPANRERCMAFAQKHGVGGPPPDKARLLEAAQTELGCTSMESCHAICEQNQQRCMEFARRHGFGGEERGGPGGSPAGAGPGGCNSEESCRKYCQEHASECAGYAPTGGGTQYQGTQGAPGSYIGPGGCKTEEECKTYCQAHPSACPGFQQGQSSYQQQPVGSYPTYYPQPTYTYQQPQSYPTYQPQPTYSYEQPQSYPTYQPPQYQTPQATPNSTP